MNPGSSQSVSSGDIFRVSHLQESLWLREQQAPEEAAYNSPIVVQVKAAVNADALASALKNLLLSNESLRACFVERDGEIWQYAASDCTAPLIVEDLSMYRRSERWRRLYAAIRREVGKPFDLQQGVLLRCAQFILNEDECVLVLVVHHIVSDGWSQGILLAELIRHYQQRAVPVQAKASFFEYAHTRRLALDSQPLFKASHDYWHDFIEKRKCAAFPSDRVPATDQPSVGRKQFFSLAPASALQLRGLCASSGTSPFTVFLAVLGLLVEENQAGEGNWCIPVTVGYREDARWFDVVGCFVDHVLVRPVADTALPFSSYLRHVHSSWQTAFAHRDYPFDRLRMEAFEKGHLLAPSVVFVYQNQAPVAALDSVELIPLALPEAPAKFDMTFMVAEQADTFAVSLEYNSTLYDEATIERLGACFIHLCERLLGTPDQPVVELQRASVKRPSIAAGERRAWPVSSFAQIFDATVRLQPEKEAIRAGSTAIRYGELKQRVDALVTQMRHLEGQGVRVGVHLNRSIELVVSVLAILSEGHCYVPLPPTCPDARLALQIADSAPALILTDCRGLERLDKVAPGSSALDVNLRGALEPWHAPSSRRHGPDAPAYLIYTSGSTGLPKGAYGLADAVLNRLHWQWSSAPYEPDDRVVLRSPPMFVDSIIEMLAPILGGACAVVAPEESLGDPRQFWQLLAVEQITHLTVVPSYLQTLLDTQVSRSDLALKRVHCSGEALPESTVLAFGKLLPGVSLVNLYGSTEVTADATWHVVGSGKLSAGMPISNTALCIIDSQGNVLPRGTPGEIAVGGSAIGGGYHAAPTLTAERFWPAPGGGRIFRSGDYGFMDEVGVCHYLGRLDMQIKVRGMRTSVLEIEAAMRELQGLRDICVIIDESDPGRLTAFCSVDTALSKSRLNEHARTLLPAHAIPNLWLNVADLPRTDSGKVVRDGRVLRALALPVDDASGSHADISVLEREVMATWTQVLGGVRLSLDDHFDQVGGHSLLAIRLVDTLNLRFGCSLRLAEFFAAPTVRDTAAFIAGHAFAGSARHELMAVDLKSRYEPFPLLLMQQAYRIGHDVVGQQQMSTICAFSMDYDALSLPDFAQAFNDCITRHDMLRAVLVGEDAQRILGEVPIYQIETLDLSQLAAPDVALKLEQYRDEFSSTRFEPGQWPSFRVAAASLGGERYRLFFAFDMLFIDLFSARLLMRELEASYQREDVQLPQIGLSFRDYVVASQSAQQGLAFERAKAYWFERMDSLGKTPQLPVSRYRSNHEASLRFNRRGMRLSRVQWQSLQARARQSQVSVTSVLLGAYASAIETWSANESFSLILTLFDRQLLHPDIDKVVGDFTSSLLFNCEPCANEVASGTFARVQSQLREVLEHRAFGGVQVQRELTRRNGGERIALPIVFTSALGLPEASSLKTSRLSGQLVHSVTQTSNVWIDCQIEEADGELIVNWDAVDEAFQGGVVESMFAYYRRLLSALATQDEAWERGLRTRVEDARLPLPCWEVPRRTLPEQVIKTATRYPDHVAVIAADQTLTYARLLDLALRLRATLDAAGMQPGERVGLLLDKGWEAVVAMLAINLGGCAYVPIDRAWPQARRDAVISAARLSLLITHPGASESLPDGCSGVVLGSAAFEISPSQRPVEALPDGIAYIIFTSGTTGVPKGVVIEHGAVLNTIESVNQLFGVTAHDRVLCVSSLCFDLSVYDIWGPLFVGGACVMLSSQESARPWRWPEIICKHNVTVWNSVPALMELLVDNCKGRGDSLASLRLALLSGDWIALTLHARLSQIVPDMQLVSLGGATEASIWSIYFPIEAVDPQWPSIPYGRALPGQNMYVLDVLLQPCPVWVAGEIYISGVGLARGYWESPEKTAAQFIRHPITGDRLYRTGDIGCYLQDGNIRFMGRRDGQVKLNGLRIELGEVEGVLQGHPMVKSAVAILNQARQLNVYVVLAAGVDLSDEAKIRRSLQDHAQAHLPGYMVPAAIQVLTALPMGANGKVDRALLQNESLPEDSFERERGSSDVVVESVVAELWQVMLAVMHPQKQENFFSSGGDSLIATRFVAKLNSIFNLDLTARTIYDHPTLQEIAEYVERCRDASGGAVEPLPMAIAAEAAEQFESFPLTDIQRSYHVGRRDDMTLGAVVAHSFIEIDYRGLELARFEEAVNCIIERHGMLRCVLQAGEQRILERVPRYHIVVDDVRDEPLHCQAQKLEATRRRLSLAANDPAIWPLFSITATRHANDVVRVHISLDIIIADAWSTNLIARDLLAFYREDGNTLPVLAFSFRDYVKYMASLRQSPHYARMRSYWQERLDSLPPPPALPVRGGSDESAAARFTRYTQVIESPQWERLKMRSLECGATPSSMLLTVFGRVLRLACDNASFLINVTHFNRPPIHPDINDIVGDFASTFLLEYRCNDGEALDAAIGALCRQILSDLDHSQYSGVQVLQDLSRRRGRVALAPVVFTSALVLPVNSGASLTLENVQGDVVYALTQTPQVWLDHQVYQEHGNLLLAWDVRDDVLDQHLVQSLFNLYVAALERLSDDPKAWHAFELEAPAPLIADCRDHMARIRAGQEPFDALLGRLQAHPRVAEAWRQAVGQGHGLTVGVRLAPTALELWANRAADMPASSLSWVERLEQKRQRMIDSRSTAINCTLPERDDASRAQVLSRRSYRSFWGRAMPDAAILEWVESAYTRPATVRVSRSIEPADILMWVASLAAVDSDSMLFPKYPYPSAGSSYAVQAYLGVAEGYGFAAGWYVLDPIARSLTRCLAHEIGSALPDEGIHLVLAAELERIALLYGDEAEAFAQLEAGAMLAVLDQAARQRGLCMQECVNDGALAIPGLKPLAGAALLAEDMPGHLCTQMPLSVGTRIYRREGAHLKMICHERGALLTEQLLCGPNPVLDGLVGGSSEWLLELYVEAKVADAQQQRLARLAIGRHAQNLMMQAPQRDFGMCMLGFTPSGMANLGSDGVRCAVLAGALDPRQQRIPQGDASADAELASVLLSEYVAEHLTHVPAAISVESGARPTLIQAADDSDIKAATEPMDLVDRAIRMIWCDVLRVPQVSLESNFFRIGGTSIDALGILGRLYELYFIELRLHDVMAEPTVGAMTRLVRSNSRWVETIYEVQAMIDELNATSDHPQAVTDIEAPVMRR